MSVSFHGGSGQIKSSNTPGYKCAFLNIIDDDEHIGVWGNCYTQPTILITKRNHFMLLAFDNIAYYQEWREKYVPDSPDEKIIIIGGIYND